MIYLIILVLLFIAELIYFCIANQHGIIDKPNERSSHSIIVLRGDGIIFLIGAWIWSPFLEFQYPWFLADLTLVAGVGFIDDVHSLPDSVRLVARSVAVTVALYQLGILHQSMWQIILLVLIVCVGATNIINSIDGVNGITTGYSLAVLILLVLLNRDVDFVERSLIILTILTSLVFCIFNFQPKGKAECSARDIGSTGIAYIMLFLLGNVIIKTGDITWLIFLLIYGVDDYLTIAHRVMLREDLGEAHRKHAYRAVANELRIRHIKAVSLCMVVQFIISLGFIYFCPSTIFAHWLYLIGTLAVVTVAYILFMERYYCLREEYLTSLKK